MIKEIIVVEGRDDERAVKAAVAASTIAVHGYGISKKTFELLEKAYSGPGIIILTDPDHAGEQIRKRLSKRFPNAKHAFLPKNEAEKDGDIGIENASPESIREALSKVRYSAADRVPEFTTADLLRFGLVGERESAKKRDQLGKALGIGYGNTKLFLIRMNSFGVTREEFERHGQALFSGND